MMLEHAPQLLLLPITGGIATFILFSIYLNHREIRGRVLPLWILTLLQTLASLSCMICFTFIKSKGAEIAGNILGAIYLYSIPLFLLFILICAFVLGVKSRMTRHIGLAAAVFAGNAILQPVLLFLALLLHPGLLE